MEKSSRLAALKFFDQHAPIVEADHARLSDQIIRYGALHIENDAVHHFQEKPDGDGAWINGGFFVLEPSVLKHIDGDNTVWEQQPLQRLAANGELSAYQHKGFWQAMDTLREKNHLEELWSSGKAPWKSW